MKDVKHLDIVTILSFMDGLTGMVSQADQMGRLIGECYMRGEMREEDMKKAHQKLSDIIRDTEVVRVELAKDMNRRIKAYLGLKYGPSDLDRYLNSLIKDYPQLTQKGGEVATQPDLKVVSKED